MQICIMLACIMLFLNRQLELDRLDRLMAAREGGLAVVYGRRRIGKTRLLVEWVARHGGLYAVADQSTPELQRRYFAQSVAQRLPGFADVEYPDWWSLLLRLARDAGAAQWRGPVVFDELPTRRRQPPSYRACFRNGSITKRKQPAWCWPSPARASA